MQPIIVLGAAVVGIALLGTGFLGDAPQGVWNWIDITLQELGWGQEMITSPISAATVDLDLKKIPNSNGTPETHDDYFDNVIRACSFHSLQSIPSAVSLGGTPDTIMAHPLIICKILNSGDENGDNKRAIAEGKLILDGVDRSALTQDQKDAGECEQSEQNNLGYDASDHIKIDICQRAFIGADDVMTAHDIKLIVEGALVEKTNGPLTDG